MSTCKISIFQRGALNLSSRTPLRRKIGSVRSGMQLVPSVCPVLQENPQTPEYAARGPSCLTTLHKFDAHASGRLPVQEKSLVPNRRVTPPYRRVMASGQPAITCEMALAQAELPHCRHQSSVELAPDLRGRTYQNPAPDAVADSVSARNRETNLTAECFPELAAPKPGNLPCQPAGFR